MNILGKQINHRKKSIMSDPLARQMLALRLVFQWKNDLISYEEMRKEITSVEAFKALNTYTGIQARAKEQSKTDLRSLIK
jgi:hypothetical protein